MMNIDSSGSDIIYDELKQCKNEIMQKGSFDINAFLDIMEARFIECGYRKSNVHQEILIIHDCGVGDFILATPCFREIRRIYPKARISIIMHHVGRQLAEHCPYFDVIYTNTHCGDQGNFIQHYEWNCELAHEYLLQHHYDIAFLFSYNSNSALLAYMSGAIRRISSLSGTGVWGGDDAAIMFTFCGI